MGHCCICNSKTGFLFKKRLGDGSEICSSCQKRISDGILESAPYLTKEEVRSWLDYSEKTPNLTDSFQESHHYGSLHLDFKNALICLCQAGNIDKTGHLKNNPGDIYRILDMTEIGLDMEAGKPRDNTLIGDLYFNANFPDYGFRLHVCVQHSVPFNSEINGNIVQYLEPGDLIFFRSDFNRIVRTTFEKKLAEIEMEKKIEQEMARKLFEARERKKREEQEKRRREKEERTSLLHDAKTAFLLDDDYTIEDLKKQKRILLKAYHPDSGNTPDQRYFKKLMSYYEVLEEHLKEGTNGTVQ